jgi:hypothetical protein
MPINPALGRLRGEDQEFEASLGYTVRQDPDIHSQTHRNTHTHIHTHTHTQNTLYFFWA